MALVEGAVEDEAQRMEALAALAEVSLVKHDPFEDGTPAVIVHRLVQAATRARSDANGSAQDAVERLIARLVAIYPKEGYRDVRSWTWCAQLTPHLPTLRGACPDATSDIADWSKLLGYAGGYLLRRAAYSQAAQVCRDSAAICEKALGPEHPDTATSLNNLASSLGDQGDFAGARPLLEHSLAIHEKVLGPEHLDMVIPMVAKDRAGRQSLRPSFEAMGTPPYRQFLEHPPSSKLKQESAPCPGAAL
jgi:Tetratricopeptide repeat